MTELKDIKFEDYWYNEACDETEIYFEAPVSYLEGKYPEANGCTFCLCYCGKEWKPEDGRIEISPFKIYTERQPDCLIFIQSDYDWCAYSCDDSFLQSLYDIYEKGES